MKANIFEIMNMDTKRIASLLWDRGLRRRDSSFLPVAGKTASAGFYRPLA